MSLKCGLLGEKLGHSLSPQIHAALGDYEYRLYEKRADEAAEFLLHGDYDVINVTIPYKKLAYGLCAEVTDEAAELKNVNVVVKRFDGTLWGDNTDAYGFAKLVEAVGGVVEGSKCVVLGTGGAGATAMAVLQRMGAGSVVGVSRTGADNYENLERHADALMVVNATPVGMFPKCDEAPVDLAVFGQCRAVIDLIYNPSPTKLLSQAERLGIRNVGGMAMLKAQAEKASSYMNANIYLYGAPGSGKSTYARKLAAEKAMALVDLDAEIERVEGRKIAEIFDSEGEAAFRAIEKRELRRAAAGRGQVVALGGGALLDDESRALAEATGRVVLIECDEATLLERVRRSSARPLLSGDPAGRLTNLLATRRQHYASFKEVIKFTLTTQFGIMI